MALAKLRLIQFRAGYNLPVHVGREKGIFDRHGLDIEITYTPGWVCHSPGPGISPAATGLFLLGSIVAH